MKRRCVPTTSLLVPALMIVFFDSRLTFGQVGACCLPGNECTQLTEEACNAINDSYFVGEGAGCPFFNCATVGACCLPNGTCDRTTESECIEAGGTFQGQGTVCAGTECPLEQSGACCLPNGACQVLSPDDCTAAQGEYFGNNTVCADVQCETDEPPPPPPTPQERCGNCGEGAPFAMVGLAMLWAFQKRRRV